KPPERVKVPPDMVPASGWPMVMPRVSEPPVAVPPPQSMVFHVRSKPAPVWADAAAVRKRSEAAAKGRASGAARGGVDMDEPPAGWSGQAASAAPASGYGVG